MFLLYATKLAEIPEFACTANETRGTAIRQKGAGHDTRPGGEEKYLDGLL